MKKILSLSAAISIFGGVYAQPAADSRLIATATFTYQEQDSAFVPYDSISLTYIGNNGWDYVTNDWKYDSLRVWKPIPFSSSWSEKTHHVQQVMNDRIVSRLSADYWGAGWQDEERTLYTYANGLVAKKQFEALIGTRYDSFRRIIITYNAHGLETENLDQHIYAGTQWRNTERKLSNYNMYKQNDTTVYQKWMYNTNTWLNDYRNIFIYSNGRLSEMVYQKSDSDGWRNVYKTAYGYINNRCVFEGYEQWDSGTEKWQKYSKVEYKYDAAGDIIEERHSFWFNNKYGVSSRSVRTYDQFHRMVTEERQQWNETEKRWFYQNGEWRIRNYYEAYTNDVKNVTSNVASMSVYPVPAKDQITISASFHQAQPVTITVRDMSGKIVKQLPDVAGAQFRKNINIADIPAGNYIINVSGTTEVATKTISIAH